MYKSTLDQWIFISYQTRKFASVPFNLAFWRYPGRPYVFRGCNGCNPETAHKGRRAAICLLCNGATYADITQLTGLHYRTLLRYTKTAPQCTPPEQPAAEIARETLRGVIDDLATLAAELSETAAPDYLRPQLDNITQEAAALLSIVE